MREEKKKVVWGQWRRLAPPPFFRKKKKKRKKTGVKRRRGEEGKRLVRRRTELRCERQIIYPSIIINSPTAVLARPTVSSSAPLSLLWVMTGSNWWILLTFSSSSFLTRADLHACAGVCVCACVRCRFPLRLCTLQYSLSFDLAQEAPLTLFCHVMWQIGPTLSEERI